MHNITRLGKGLKRQRASVQFFQIDVNVLRHVAVSRVLRVQINSAQLHVGCVGGQAPIGGCTEHGAPFPRTQVYFTQFNLFLHGGRDWQTLVITVKATKLNEFN